ncbi:MAG: thioredoxin domain-containing protein [Bacteroidota bacterium]|nr:thioredoxin domain-containing protein [Bacteroidota bacterium]MDP4229737.1 thioredoxin domain-containing protein [Bacteroidota bacterium]
MNSTDRRTNRLIHERSPYLLQHAYNPVDWFAWGEEAFEKARKEMKPIFLSIGYSTCHWCHVMERESFEDEKLAAYLNSHFVSIKLDREERPDIDAIYMAATQAMTGSGGWPMTVILTPALKPFFCGTYFPPKPAYGKPSFRQLLERITDLWATKRDELISSSEGLTQTIAGNSAPDDSGTKLLSPTLGDAALYYFDRTFDEEYGGFGPAPKFPRPAQFDFLFNHYSTSGSERAKEMALLTLRRMALGGINDHLGGGFHRYSVDNYWLVSHFEKMLYDQAQLVESYLDAYQITGESIFADTVRSTCDFVLRELTHSEGAFFSALDADSEGEEGTYYVWTRDEIAVVLGAEHAKIFSYLYGITESGNWEHSKNVISIKHSIQETAIEFGLKDENIEQIISASKAKLFTVRSKRIRPHLDDKILASWNGLMIGAMARAGDVVGESRYREAAVRAATFVWQKLYEETGGKLLHRWRDGEARFDATLDTYAYLIKGFLELFEASLDEVWLQHAIQLQQEQDTQLYDQSSGGYFTSREAADIIIRTKNDYDGAEPSGNSVSVLNLLRLHSITANPELKEKAERTLLYFAGKLAKYPYTMPEMLVAMEWHHYAPSEIVFAGDIMDNHYLTMRGELAQFYLPRKVLISTQTGQAGDFAKSLTSKDGKLTVYFCTNRTCELPITEPSDLKDLLEKTRWKNG